MSSWSSRSTRYQNTIPYHKIKKTLSPQNLSPTGKKKSRARRVSVIEMPILENVTKSLTIHAMVFLNTRPMMVNCGTLLVAVENGAVQVWSHHSGGGYLGEFFTIHTAGDYVVSLATDPDNEYLFTGHTAGYVKTWLMKSYMVPEEHQSKVVMPKYRLQFPFLWKDRVEGRAKRAVREQPLPILLSSYRAHLEAVTHIEYLAETRIVIRERTAFSSSSDHTVRLWTLGGRYVGTLGTFQPWINLQNDMEPQGPFRIPPDIKRVASSTTLKVLKGGDVQRTTILRPAETEVIREIPAQLLSWGTYGKRAKSPILGQHFQMPSRIPTPARQPKLDVSFNKVPVYCHLACRDLSEFTPFVPPKDFDVEGMSGREGERHSMDSQPTKVSFHTNKNRWITETVDGASYQTDAPLKGGERRKVEGFTRGEGVGRRSGR
uniref:WD repeat-containing protein on Y chromosome n=1 Tax=Timema poppense TaxID=170557 RepID=A0A7R9CX16_TIMPO|nr:unnamed protein product [Timema poppensis]